MADTKRLTRSTLLQLPLTEVAEILKQVLAHKGVPATAQVQIPVDWDSLVRRVLISWDSEEDI